MIPVLIVGAGPVGMTLAGELARYGVPVRIVDKSARRTDKSKALVVWSRTLELLDRGGSAARFVEAGLKADAFNFVAGEKVIGRFSMANVDSPYPFGLMLPQSETERLLDERLAAVGIAVERQVELIRCENGKDGVAAVLRHADGREEMVSAAWLIGCDGAHSLVRQSVDATFDGETLDNDWMLADVMVRGYPQPDSEVSVHWHRDGILIIFPILPGRYRIVWDLPPSGAAHPSAPTLEQVQAVLNLRGPAGLVASDPIWLSAFRINGRKVSKYRWGRIFLAGDAAHVHSPAGGQGMNTGMQDAFNLSWKLAMAIRGTAGERLLDSYSPERSAIGEQVLKAADRITEIGTVRNPVAQLLRNLIGHLVLGLHPVQHVLADTMTEVAIGYPGSPLNGPSIDGGPKPGARVAPAVDQAPVGSGTTPLFALFADSTKAVTDLVRRFDGWLDADVRPSFRPGGIWLVRPDGYVLSSADDIATIMSHLNAVLAP